MVKVPITTLYFTLEGSQELLPFELLIFLHVAEALYRGMDIDFGQTDLSNLA